MPGSIKALRDHGFELFDDIVDHSYDSEPDQIKRQVMILDQLCAWKDRTFNAQHLVDFDQRIKYNKDLLKNFRSNWPKKLQHAIEILK
jgi:hypothetical protein